MNINYLREFVVLAQTGNYLEAAELLYIAQSSLSKHIQNMEQELNTPLFTRTTRKVELSASGRMLLPYAAKIVQLQDEYTTALLNSKDEAQNSIRVGSIPALAQYNITDVLVKFKKSHHDMALSITQAGSDELKEKLRKNKCDLAFIRETDMEIQEDEFVRIPYAKDVLVAVLPAGHPFANEKEVSLTQLKDENFLLLEEHTMLYELSKNACERNGFAPQIAFTDHKLESLVDLVLKGLGVALLMKRLAIYFANPSIAVVEITPNVSTQINLCYRKDAKLTEAAKLFIKCAES